MQVTNSEVKRRMKYKVPLADPYVTDEDVMAVAEAVRRKCLSQGEYVRKFEDELAKCIGVKRAIAVNNGTAALHAALAAINIGSGDEVIVPSFSFVATANAVLYQRAKPVFVDIDPLTYNIDPLKIEEKVTDGTKAIIPVHYAGQPVDIDPLDEIAEKHDLYVIEDAAEAHGSLYKGKKAGCLGDIACFSFYPNKNMTTGEGGMITTDDEELAEKMRMIRSHGQDERYHHVMLGFNYRMTDFQAALGLVQLKRLNWVVSMKVTAAEYYNQKLAESFGNKFKVPYVAPYAFHTYMFYPMLFEDRTTRDMAMIELEKRGVETRVAFPPIHLQPLYRKLFGYKEGFLPLTEKVSETILCLPIYPHIKKEEQDYVVESLKEMFK